MPYTHEDFRTLPLDVIAELTGLTPPDGGDPEAIGAFREQAWRGYAADLENAMEWGTARQGQTPPAGPPDPPEGG